MFVNSSHRNPLLTACTFFTLLHLVHCRGVRGLLVDELTIKHVINIHLFAYSVSALEIDLFALPW